MGAGVSAAGEIFAEKGHFEQGWCFAASFGIQRPGGLDRRTQLWRPFGQALESWYTNEFFFFFFFFLSFFSFLFSGGFAKSPHLRICQSLPALITKPWRISHVALAFLFALELQSKGQTLEYHDRVGQGWQRRLARTKKNRFNAFVPAFGRAEWRSRIAPPRQGRTRAGQMQLRVIDIAREAPHQAEVQCDGQQLTCESAVGHVGDACNRQ